MKQLELQQKIWELIATEHSHLNYLKTVINVSHHCICYHTISSCVCLCVVCCVSVCCVLCVCVLCVAIHAEFGAYQKGSSSCGGKCQACVVQSPVLLTPPFPSLFSVISHLPNVTKYLHGHHLITFAISSLHHLIPPPPHPSTTSSLHHLISPPPHPSITSSLHHLIPPPPHPSTTSSLHHLIPTEQDSYHNVFGYMEDIHNAHDDFWNHSLQPCVEKVWDTVYLLVPTID